MYKYSFIFKLLKLLISDYIFLIPIAINLIIYWSIFFKSNLSLINKKNTWDKSISIKNVILTQNPSFIIRLGIVLSLAFCIYLYTYKGYSTTFWWSHFKVNNYSLYMYSITILFNIYFMYISDKHLKLNNSYSIDFIFAVINIMLFIPLIFLSNTLFTFFFVIELVSCCIFYKFIVGKISFNKKTKDNFFSIYSKTYLNVLFYQYWSSFFSSVLIVFSIYFMFIISGTTEWSIINFTIALNNQISYIDNRISILFIAVILIIGFLIKLGSAPLQLYKIEVYKGLPFLSIFFYTTFYFVVFFLFFVLLFIYYLSSLVNVYWFVLITIVLIGTFYIITLIFDINLFKAFLAYSTIINSISFILLTLAIIF